ncbi:ras association domain-containing protein 2-like isoform X2 [Pomacea canaliculata]|uniref:ras association domain-containing protein 2-like isoform X2 n=1 Tax=Pomacea canaliculata TaxID=400727 RepID=UPI000D72C8D8|nr:ras association domain-containing protein 2-like isoform X2 [Pomacea canaliculata]
MGSVIQRLYQDAERKTSLGRDWHPNCLRCTKCDRVLVPGQHAEHKGNPYCHTPCYKALFGPPILGYGANLSSPANFARKDGPVEFGYDNDSEVYKREIFSNRRIATNPLQRQRKSVPAIPNYEFPVSDKSAHRSCPTSPSKTNDTVTSPKLRDMYKKVEEFNARNQGKIHHPMTVEQLPSGEVCVQGPLRIYWGLTRPIQLRQCDDVPAPPVAKWRHSLCVNLNESPTKQSRSPTQLKLDLHSPKWDQQTPSRQMRGIDDSVLMSPSAADDVVMRRGNIRKFKTVAYRGDAPTKWKRASINGHIFNFDTSVFTPVLGSCTSVMVDSTMTSPVVIQTLLEKFKVENSPSEYTLCLVTDNDEHILEDEDRPLLEVLELSVEDQGTKIFLKERQLDLAVTPSDPIIQLPIAEEEEEEALPEEVEQLMILPVAVLTGLLKKFENDEESEVRRVKEKYKRYRKRVLKLMEKHTASTA